jgi:hypothetical protein
VIKSQATLDPYERRLIGFLKKKDDVRSSDAFVEFVKRNPAIAENITIAFLSSERARAGLFAGIKHPNGYVGTSTNSI